jgi:hypothetical protein
LHYASTLEDSSETLRSLFCSRNFGTLEDLLDHDKTCKALSTCIHTCNLYVTIFFFSGFGFDFPDLLQSLKCSVADTTVIAIVNYIRSRVQALLSDGTAEIDRGIANQIYADVVLLIGKG